MFMSLLIDQELKIYWRGFIPALVAKILATVDVLIILNEVYRSGRGSTPKKGD
jgi:hypothetical protein